MSGSPIYLEGKLAGALSYGWHFGKDPVAGVTPIENMIAELRRPLRGRARRCADAEPEAEPGGRALVAPLPRREMLRGARRRRRHARGLAAPVAACRRLTPRGLLPEPRLVRASVPLSLAGCPRAPSTDCATRCRPSTSCRCRPAAPAARPRWRTSSPAARSPSSSSAATSARPAPAPSPASKATRCSRSATRCSTSARSTCPSPPPRSTRSWRRSSQSFKMASPLQTLGSLVQDRQSCIVGDTAQRADMIPVPGQGADGPDTRTASSHRGRAPPLPDADPGRVSVVASAVQTGRHRRRRRHGPGALEAGRARLHAARAHRHHVLARGRDPATMLLSSRACGSCRSCSSTPSRRPASSAST